MKNKNIKTHNINMLENVSMLDLAKMNVIYNSKIEITDEQLNSLNKNDLIELIQVLIKKNNDNCYKIAELEDECKDLQSCLNEYL